MKAAHGKQITCCSGHCAGYFRENVRDGTPVLSDAMEIKAHRRGDQWICAKCDALIAEERSEGGWRVHTQQGWIQ
ncbi:hypothetical protein [Methylocella sp. CPCC 101449]|uniref:hypothetical protein n=1 Tax=Methylocella sp. CPCC 101449 TaxID=2987531 RepID=UPI00288C87D1|nr:hypothetical protein [Methylocella sp. CPCC 101449]MDT2022839.1 hypothetical protein [Methylocella sp. CPCC 101449]